MSIRNRFHRYMAGLRTRRDLARTERMIASLPPEVQKDIGWPRVYENPHDRLVREHRRHGGI